MATLKNWRVIYINEKGFLIAHTVEGHPSITSGPILTSEVVMGKLSQGEMIQTKSGTTYILEEPLPEEEDVEFARPLLIARVSRNFQKNSMSLKLEHLEQLNSIIDKILLCKNK